MFPSDSIHDIIKNQTHSFGTRATPYGLPTKKAYMGSPAPPNGPRVPRHARPALNAMISFKTFVCARLKLIKLKSFVLPDGPYYEMVKSNFERAGE